MRPTVLAYYFPDWHADPRNAAWFGAGWTEWSLLQAARPRFPGHRQPRVPALGYRDEADPACAFADIALAAAHGVDGFLFDYYWYDDGPYLEGALSNGFLRAENRSQVKFALMWANHQLVDIFPDRRTGVPGLLKNGALDRTAFEEMARHVISRYFSEPNYLTMDGRPWFTVYDLANFIDGLGGVAAARDALDWFRAETVAAGFPGLHLDAVLWSSAVLPTSSESPLVVDWVRELGFDSGTSYVWVHHHDVGGSPFPEAPIEAMRESAFAEYERYADLLDVDFHPNVTVGWDPSPRTDQSHPYAAGSYPWTSVWDPGPAAFAEGLRQARDFVVRRKPRHPIITVNAWNEWTEGSYLLPDTTHGTAFLEVIRDTLGIDGTR
ncbi:glycoside hydrolase family 99-like domain-containing protein [Kribbella sp. NBC_01505]|uniref:glycoside hydrolase family 99-like domain-containing protein n=1 Tax=Kribbella sp. NBC_01505 TaxID=2903580 RepID=UPI00386E31BF